MTSTVGPVSAGAMRARLEALEGRTVDVVRVEPLAGDRGATDLKRTGYGVPLLVEYRCDGRSRTVVFRTQSPNWYGHDRRADRAALSVLAADTFADQPRHVGVLDVGAIRAGELVSLHGAGEFYLVTDYVPGTLYAADLREIERTCSATALDLARVDALADHLVEVHSVGPADDAAPRWARAVRDLIGSGEGIFGIVDGYPVDFEDADRLRRIEESTLAWRWGGARRRAPAVRRTHGDFHPYNILFREGVEFTALDASRGGVGDPADDLAALAINFLFGGLRCPGAWTRGFAPLWFRFFDRYLGARGADGEHALDAIGPFLAWRSLVLASPAWYPGISRGVRRALLDAAVGWLELERPDAASLAALALPLPSEPRPPRG